MRLCGARSSKLVATHSLVGAKKVATRLGLDSCCSAPVMPSRPCMPDGEPVQPQVAGLRRVMYGRPCHLRAHCAARVLHSKPASAFPFTRQLAEHQPQRAQSLAPTLKPIKSVLLDSAARTDE